MLALNAKTGELLWKYKRELPEDFSALHNTNRGVALYGDKVYVTGLEPVVIALDAKTGKVVWEAKMERLSERLLRHPGAADRQRQGHGGRIRRRVRHSWLRRGLRQRDRQGSLEDLHRPGPGRARQRDLGEADTWQRGGASVWMTGTYDPETKLTFWGTGNGSPWFGDQRPGDNLYTSSTIALNPDTGKLTKGTSSTTRTIRGTGTR